MDSLSLTIPVSKIADMLIIVNTYADTISKVQTMIKVKKNIELFSWG